MYTLESLAFYAKFYFGLMDFMTPPMFDPSNILVWKAKMSVYLQTLGHKVHLSINKESFLSDSKHIGANAQALEAIRSTLPREYLIRVSNIDSAFAVWNILTTTTISKLQLPIQPEESSGESDSQCYMIQGNDSLELSLIHI